MNEVDNDEEVSRFIINEKKQRYISKNNVPKAQLFNIDNRGKTSVFRTSGLAENDIRQIGCQVAEERPNNVTLWGRAYLSVDDIVNISLSVVSDEPPHGHASIVNWPEDNESEQKSLQLQLAALSNLEFTECVTRLK